MWGIIPKNTDFLRENECEKLSFGIFMECLKIVTRLAFLNGKSTLSFSLKIWGYRFLVPILAFFTNETKRVERQGSEHV